MGAFTQADLTRIQRAIASGALSVRYGNGRMVTYRSLDELLRQKAVIERDLGAVDPVRKVMATSKGTEAHGLERRGTFGDDG